MATTSFVGFHEMMMMDGAAASGAHAVAARTRTPVTLDRWLELCVPFRVAWRQTPTLASPRPVCGAGAALTHSATTRGGQRAMAARIAEVGGDYEASVRVARSYPKEQYEARARSPPPPPPACA